MTAGCFAKAFFCFFTLSFFSYDTEQISISGTIQPIWLVITDILLVALSFFYHFKTEHSIYSSLFNSRLYSREITALPLVLLIISITSPALWRLSLQLQLYLTSLTCLSLSLPPPPFFPISDRLAPLILQLYSITGPILEAGPFSFLTPRSLCVSFSLSRECRRVHVTQIQTPKKSANPTEWERERKKTKQNNSALNNEYLPRKCYVWISKISQPRVFMFFL